MKVIALTAENLLRLSAVHIEPGDDPVVTISGANGAGIQVYGGDVLVDGNLSLQNPAQRQLQFQEAPAPTRDMIPPARASAAPPLPAIIREIIPSDWR